MLTCLLCATVHGVQKSSKVASRGAQNSSLNPGNDHCAVKSLPGRCRFEFGVVWRPVRRFGRSLHVPSSAPVKMFPICLSPSVVFPPQAYNQLALGRYTRSSISPCCQQFVAFPTVIPLKTRISLSKLRPIYEVGRGRTTASYDDVYSVGGLFPAPKCQPTHRRFVSLSTAGDKPACLVISDIALRFSEDPRIGDGCAQISSISCNASVIASG